MPKTIPEKLDWSELNPAFLPEAVKPLWAAKKAADTVAKEAREAFEEAARKAIDPATVPAGREARFGYWYGKLTMAWGPITAKKAATGKGPVNPFGAPAATVATKGKGKEATA